jgi:hypothetical protein
MVSHVDDSAMRSAAFMLATTPLQGRRQENDYRTTGNTGNSKEWPRRKIAGGKGAKGGNPLQQSAVRDSSTISKTSLSLAARFRRAEARRKPAETGANPGCSAPHGRGALV